MKIKNDTIKIPRDIQIDIDHYGRIDGHIKKILKDGAYATTPVSPGPWTLDTISCHAPIKTNYDGDGDATVTYYWRRPYAQPYTCISVNTPYSNLEKIYTTKLQQEAFKSKLDILVHDDV